MNEELQSFHDMVDLYAKDVKGAEHAVELLKQKRNDYITAAEKVLSLDMPRFFPDAPKMGEKYAFRHMDGGEVMHRVTSVYAAFCSNTNQFYATVAFESLDNPGQPLFLAWPHPRFHKAE